VEVSATPKLGDELTCHNCASRLQISSLVPLDLDWAVDDPEDEVKLDYTSEDDYTKR
jgi:hypothetical protein